jgi:membrane-associated protease RseP (regulator of RpoE activity)
MNRRHAPLIALAAILLIATGAIAGVLVAQGGDGESQSSGQGSGQGYLGLTVSATSAGLRVGSVEADGPADAAGVQVGDIVRAVDDTLVRTPEGLRSAVEAHAAGTQVTLTIERGDRQVRAGVKLGESPENAEIESPPGAPFDNVIINRTRLGVRIQQIDAEVQAERYLQRDEGVVVVDVTPDSAADRAGLQPNDVFVSVNGVSTTTLQQLQRALAAVPNDRTIQIRVLRGTTETTLSATLGPQFNLQNLPNLPPDLRERLQEQLNQGLLSPDQLSQLLRPYLSGRNAATIGQVKQATPTSLVVRTTDGREVGFVVNDETEIRRAAATIRPADLRPDELVLVLSMDGGRTAFSVNAFGVTDLQR